MQMLNHAQSINQSMLTSKWECLMCWASVVDLAAGAVVSDILFEILLVALGTCFSVELSTICCRVDRAVSTAWATQGRWDRATEAGVRPGTHVRRRQQEDQSHRWVDREAEESRGGVQQGQCFLTSLFWLRSVVCWVFGGWCCGRVT